MTGFAMPTTAHNARALTPREYEDLMFPAMPDGVFGHPADPPVVYADGSPLGLKIRANRVIYIRGLRYETGPAELPITLTANTTAGTSRRDLIVARMTRNPWDVAPAVVPGTAVASPVTPSPTYGSDTSTGVWEMPLAAATVNYNSTAVTVTPLHWYVGSDGQIRCTTSTYPPREAGRAVWVHPEGRWEVSSGDNWLTAVEDSGITGITLQSGYTAALNRVQRRNGLVVLSLEVSRTTELATATTVRSIKVGQLPDGFHPTFDTPGTVQYESSAGQSMGLRAATTGGVFIEVPIGVLWRANRPLPGSLTFHAA